MHNRSESAAVSRGDALALFLNLYLGHLLGDFLFQPGRLVAAKRDGVPGILVHAVIVGASTALVLIGRLYFYWPVVVMIAGLHLVIEEVTILAYTRTPTRPLYTFLFDQSLHMLSMALLVWLWGDWNFNTTAMTFGVHITTVQLAALCAIGTATLLGSIFVFEVGNTVFAGDGSKGRLLKLDRARLGGMAERGAAVLLALLVSPILVAAPFIPRIVYAVRRTSGLAHDRNLLEAAAGLALCVACYAGVLVVAVLVTQSGYVAGSWWRVHVL